jgi:hypothetical protein
MNAIRARLIAILAGYLLARLATWGILEATPQTTADMQLWLNQAFELLMLVGYAVVHPWIQKHVNPTGAMTAESARQLEQLSQGGVR